MSLEYVVHPTGVCLSASVAAKIQSGGSMAISHTRFSRANRQQALALLDLAESDQPEDWMVIRSLR